MPLNAKNPLAFLLISASVLTVRPVAAQNLEPSTEAFAESFQGPAPIHTSPVIPRAFIPLAPNAERAILSGAQPSAISFFRDLMAAAEAADSAEMDFRQEAAGRITALEKERAFAFRRLNLMHAVAEAVHSAEREEIAVANALTMLRARLGWNSDTTLRASVFAHFSPVVLAAFRVVAPNSDGPEAEVREELAAFENWYAETWGAAFWNLFENPMPDTPRVDF